MKILISLSDEDNLTTLKNIAPNFNYQYFSGNPVMHSPWARRLNESLTTKQVIDLNAKRRKRKAKKDAGKVKMQDLPENQLTGQKHATYVNEAEKRDTVVPKNA